MKKIAFPKKTKIAIATIALLLCCGELFARFGLGLGGPPLSITDPDIEYMFKPNQNFLAPTMLENELRNNWSSPVRERNVSAGSWGPPNMLVHLKKFGDFDADIVNVTLSSHDAQDYPTFESLNPNTHPTEKPISALWEGVQRYLPRYLPSLASAAPEVDYKIDPAKQELVLNDFSELLRLEKEKGKRVILMHHLEKKELSEGIALKGRDILLQGSEDVDAVVFSDSNILSMVLHIGKNPFQDNIHLNEIGNTSISYLVVNSTVLLY